MIGMRTKGADFSTDFGKLTASKTTLPLARVQASDFDYEDDDSIEITFDNMFEDTDQIVFMGNTKPVSNYQGMYSLYIEHNGERYDKIATDDIKSTAYNLLNEFPNATIEIYETYIDIVDAEGETTASKKIAMNTDNNDPVELEFYSDSNDLIDSTPFISEQAQGLEIKSWLDSGNSIMVADGKLSKDYSEVINYFTNKTASKKQATYFDGYSYRVTIEAKAGDVNGSYTMVTNMLSASDIRYRELRRYTVEPDRVLMDILITDEDVDVIKGLADQLPSIKVVGLGSDAQRKS